MINIAHFRTTLFSAFSGALILLGFSACNNNQNSKNVSAASDSLRKPESDNVNSMNDTMFLIKVANINLEEIKLGQLAVQKSKMADIKKLGKMMQDDHRKSMRSLIALTNKKSITIPASLDSSAQADYKNLNSKSGRDFEKNYCDMMVNGHKEAIAMFEKDSADSNDADIRQWAIATLPTLREHLAHSVMCLAEVEK